jgi:hypothetical protein
MTRRRYSTQSWPETGFRHRRLLVHHVVRRQVGRGRGSVTWQRRSVSAVTIQWGRRAEGRGGESAGMADQRDLEAREAGAGGCNVQLGQGHALACVSSSPRSAPATSLP